MEKLTSRKFWVCVAAMLASIATSIAGIHSNNPTVIAIGTICGIVSAAIYAFCEAWVDAKAVDTRDMAQAMFNVLMEEHLNDDEEGE
jgi:hypothetical protein